MNGSRQEPAVERELASQDGATTKRELTATYRIQLTPDFGFRSLRQRVAYLRDLGVSTIYLSPIFQARPGSRHGYDVIDPTKLNDELGTPEEFDDLLAAAEEAGLTILLDIVPNHMAASVRNPWWSDVLQQGTDSPYASFFDVDWDTEPVREHLSDKVMLPILGRPYGDVLEDQEIRIVYDRGAFRAEYYERRLPLNFASYGRILGRVRRRLGADAPDAAAALESIILAVEEWGRPGASGHDQARIEELHARIDEVASAHDEIRRSIDRVLRVLNGVKGDAESFDALDAILEEQSYRLSFWRNAAEEINYRRFFDITDLISVRVSDPEVFAATHALALALAKRPVVAGLRLDHVDGLLDPAGYLEMLREALGNDPRSGSEVGQSRPLIVSEKILGEGERVPETFAFRGTTGYEFARALDRLFVDQEGFERLRGTFESVTGMRGGFHAVARASKMQVLRDLFRGELAKYTRRFAQLSSEDRHARDLPLSALEEALVQFIASVPVYRTYVRADGVLDRDLAIIRETSEDAARHVEDDLTRSGLEFLRRVLSLETEDASQVRAWRRFTMRLQQFTGPVAAKGIEDTALYVYAPLVSLNEVGAEPVLPDDPVSDFHEMNRERLAITPETLNATSTHDTKRGEDTRARIHAISRHVDDWLEIFELGKSIKPEGMPSRDASPSSRAETAPSPAEVWFFLQNLLGAWPLDQPGHATLEERLREYVPKALREAKVHSHWTAVNEDWERGVADWIESLLRDDGFRALVETQIDPLAFEGMLHSLAMTVLKIGSPGIPDIYQGSEMWNLSLVDPDNRRDVDYDLRSRTTADFIARGHDESLLDELKENWRDGRIKLWLTWRALGARGQSPELFLRGDYVPLTIEGPRAAEAIAFARRLRDQWRIVVAGTGADTGRETWPVGDHWRGTSILIPQGAPARWKSMVSNGSLRTEAEGLALSETLTRLPVTILSSAPD